MSLVLLQNKLPFTVLENTILPCLKIAARLLHGGKSAVEKVKKIPLSDTTVRILDAAKRWPRIWKISKLNKSPSFSLQLDETTDISSDAQLIVFCKFADVEEDKIV